MKELKLIGRRIRRLIRQKTFSVEDGCYVALVRCAFCHRGFFEEFEYGIRLAVEGLPSVCLRCDGAEIDAPAISAVLVEI